MTLHALADALTPTEDEDEYDEVNLNCEACGNNTWELHVWGGFERWDTLVVNTGRREFRDYGDNETDTRGDDGWQCARCRSRATTDQAELFNDMD